jgi:hypothetical protein
VLLRKLRAILAGLTDDEIGHGIELHLRKPRSCGVIAEPC